jgi:hypothetical protein
MRSPGGRLLNNDNFERLQDWLGTAWLWHCCSTTPLILQCKLPTSWHPTLVANYSQLVKPRSPQAKEHAHELHWITGTCATCSTPNRPQAHLDSNWLPQQQPPVNTSVASPANKGTHHQPRHWQAPAHPHHAHPHQGIAPLSQPTASLSNPDRTCKRAHMKLTGSLEHVQRAAPQTGHKLTLTATGWPLSSNRSSSSKRGCSS